MFVERESVVFGVPPPPKTTLPKTVRDPVVAFILNIDAAFNVKEPAI
jgi:hypothetical protein